MNSVSLIGFVGAEPKYKEKLDNKSVWFDLAVNRPRSKRVDYIPIAAFGGTAEVIEKYVHKGSRIGVSGYVGTNMFKTQDGSSRKMVNVVVQDIVFLSRNENRASTDTGFESASDFEDVPEDDLEELPFA